MQWRDGCKIGGTDESSRIAQVDSLKSPNWADAKSGSMAKEIEKDNELKKGSGQSQLGSQGHGGERMTASRSH